jgi:hypothetical protein
VDKNAVAFILTAGNLKLGHVSADIAPKYVSLLRANAIKSARVTKVEMGRDRKGDRTVVHVAVTCLSENIGPQEALRFIAQVIRKIPSSPGIYHITCSKTQRTYVGQSKIVKDRIKQHLEDLIGGRHDNYHMQDDFYAHGRRHFTFTFISRHPDQADRDKAERLEIEALMKRGQSLYNLTSDGQGRQPGSQRDDYVPPISDWRSTRRPSKSEPLMEFAEKPPGLPAASHPSTHAKPTMPKPPTPARRPTLGAKAAMIYFMCWGVVLIGIFVLCANKSNVHR